MAATTGTATIRIADIEITGEAVELPADDMALLASKRAELGRLRSIIGDQISAIDGALGAQLARSGQRAANVGDFTVELDGPAGKWITDRAALRDGLLKLAEQGELPVDAVDAALPLGEPPVGISRATLKRLREHPSPLVVALLKEHDRYEPMQRSVRVKPR